ncbi:MAG: hypothetical protein ACH37Z_11495 [Anaerolineae bacterium]
MNRSDIGHFYDASGPVSNDTATIGGAINRSAPIADELSNGLFQDIPVPAEGEADEVYYQTAWKGIDGAATGTLTDACLYLRSGLKPNWSIGVASIVSTSALDTGTVYLTGKEDGDNTAFDQDPVVAAGTTSVDGVISWDTYWLKRAEYTVGGVAAKPVGNITISVQGEIVGVIWGTGLPAASDSGKGNTMCTAEYQLRAASAKNTAITWSGSANRRTAPTGNLAGDDWDYATRWPGGDESLPLSDDYEADDEVNYCAQLTVFAGFPLPFGELVLDVDLQGRGVS